MGKTLVNRPVRYYPLPESNPPSGSSGSYPFELSIISDNNVSITDFSYLMQNFNVRDNIPILGLNYSFKLSYKDKIYVQVVFDYNGQVAYARLDNRPYWKIFNAGTSGGTRVPIYPTEIANLSKADQSQYAAFLTDESSRLAAQYAAHLAWIQNKDKNGFTDAYITAQTTYVNKIYGDATTKLQSIISAQSTFFSQLTSVGIIRKQVAAFIVIGYTTQDNSDELNATTITPPQPTSGTSNDDPTTKAFQYVPCLTSDLELVDTFFQYTACRCLIERPRPIYTYLDPITNIAEDITNTKDDGS